MTVSGYLTWVAMATFLILGMVAFGFWMRFFLKKVAPNLKYQIKYSVLKKKYDEGVVKRLMQYLDANMSADDVFKLIITSPTNKRSFSQVKEIIYIYSQMQKAVREVKT